MTRLGIEQLSTFGMSPIALARLAADLGCAYISTGLAPTLNVLEGFAPWSLRDDPALRRELAAVTENLGITISLGEGCVVMPGGDVRNFAADLDIFAEIGVGRINTLSMDPDLGRTLDQFAMLVEMAGDRGIEVVLEFSGTSPVGALSKALGALRHVGRPNFRLLIDAMHYFRIGGTVAALAATDPDAIGYIQLCDVPLKQRFETYAEEARFERMVPGEGELPLFDLLAALPRHLVIGLEIPLWAAAQAGEDAHARIGRCVAAANRLIGRLESHDAGLDQPAY